MSGLLRITPIHHHRQLMGSGCFGTWRQTAAPSRPVPNTCQETIRSGMGDGGTRLEQRWGTPGAQRGRRGWEGSGGAVKQTLTQGPGQQKMSGRDANGVGEGGLDALARRAGQRGLTDEGAQWRRGVGGGGGRLVRVPSLVFVPMCVPRPSLVAVAVRGVLLWRVVVRRLWRGPDPVGAVGVRGGDAGNAQQRHRRPQPEGKETVKEPIPEPHHAVQHSTDGRGRRMERWCCSQLPKRTRTAIIVFGGKLPESRCRCTN